MSKKHFFKPRRDLAEVNLRAQISKALYSVQTDMDVVEKKVSAFERRLEEIFTRLDDLESRLKRLEELLE